MKNIAVLTGGFSKEAQIASKSAHTIFTHLNREQYTPYLITIAKEGWFMEFEGVQYLIDKNDFTAMYRGDKIAFEAVFIGIHGTPGEDGKLQAYFDMLDIPYSTSGHLASTLSFNKYACNAYLMQHSIRCATSVVVFRHMPFNPQEIIDTVGLPCFVKPNDGGSSFGISKVSDFAALSPAIYGAFEHGNEVIVEAFVSGTEVTCGLLEKENELFAFPLIEIVSHNDFFDFEAKYNGESEEILPARIDDATTAKVQELSKTIFRILNLRFLARIDFIIKDGVPYCIEANTIPGLSNESLIPQMAAAADLSLEDMFGGMLELVLKK